MGAMQFARIVVLLVILSAAAGLPALQAPSALAGIVTAGADTLTYKVEPGDTILGICAAVRDRTGHYALEDLREDIRLANGLRNHHLSVGQILAIPVAGPDPGPRVALPVAGGAEPRGIYISGPAAGVSTVLQRIDRFVEAGGNAVVLDAKDIDGILTYRSAAAAPRKGPGPYVPSLPRLLDRLGEQDLYRIARLAVFLDGDLGARRPDLALADPAGEPWRERGCVWMDPAEAEVRSYNLALVAELARAGFEEIQLDYIRYPTNGWRGDWTGSLEGTAALRRAHISRFVAAARDTAARYGSRLSVALFGVMAWGRTADLALTGQDVRVLAACADVICPMVYPSHFGPGFGGYADPAENPEGIVGEAVLRFRELAGPGTEIRPWLQSFAFGVRDFGPEYVGRQVTASRLSGGDGWCFWNPACRYEVLAEHLQGKIAMASP